jgi:hypothetical protein
MVGYDAWFQSLMVQPRTAYGVRLRPFSLIHSLTLGEMVSPYTYGHCDPTPTDALTATMVCSRTWAEIRRDIVPVIRPVVLWRMWWAGRRHNHAHESAVLTAYFDDFSSRPEHWVTQGAKKGHAIKAPYEFHLAHILCEHWGLSESEAWDFPIGRAHCYTDTYAETQGDESLVSHREEVLAKIAAESN